MLRVKILEEDIIKLPFVFQMTLHLSYSFTCIIWAVVFVNILNGKCSIKKSKNLIINIYITLLVWLLFYTSSSQPVARWQHIARDTALSPTEAFETRMSSSFLWDSREKTSK